MEGTSATPVRRDGTRSAWLALSILGMTFAIVLVVVVGSRPEPGVCGVTANPFRGVGELVAFALLGLVAVVLGIASLVAFLFGRDRLALALLAVAAGLVLAIVASAFVPRPAECIPDTRRQAAELRVSIDAPFRSVSEGRGECYALDDPDSGYGASIYAYDLGDMMELSVEDPLGAPYVNLVMLVDGAVAMYDGRAESGVPGIVRFTDLPSVEFDPTLPPISGSISWVCGSGTPSPPEP